MKAERWAQIEPILDQAFDLSDSEREAFLDRACGDDVDLRAEVEALLVEDAHSGGLLGAKGPVTGHLDAVLGRDDIGARNAGAEHGVEFTDPLPAQIGSYRIERELGRGGMGVVYLAEQTAPIRRQVAIKVIRAGHDFGKVSARFESERQALALMNSPHIAKVLEAGETDDGRPYFAMEFVDGESITEYCDHHQLPLAERLDLFGRVCGAIQHAHRRGVIHRDIKPSNVLVTERDGEPQPVVIDFGVAKALEQTLTERTLFTELGQLVGTPEYMSPEQADARPDLVDTRTDVYSLGVLLYELLVGHRPLSREQLLQGGLAELYRRVRETDPPKPSTRLSTLDVDTTTRVATARGLSPEALSRQLEGELDWIVLRAIEKEPDRRYPSPEAMADDLARFRTDRPIAAKQTTTLYRMRKWARRNRTLSVATVAIAVALVVGAVGLVWGILTANRERNEARRQAAVAEAINRFVREDLLDRANLNRGGERDITVLEALRGAATDLENRFAGQKDVEASLRGTLASALRALGESEEALPHLERALELFRDSVGAEHPFTITALIDLAGVYTELARYQEAEPLMLESLELSRRLYGVDDDGVLTVQNNLAFLYDQQGRYSESEPLHSDVLAKRERLLGDEHLNTLISMNNTAWVNLRLDRRERARELWTRKRDIASRVLGDDHPETLTSHLYLAQVALADSAPERVVEQIPPVHERSSRVLGESHPITVTMLESLALARQQLGEHQQAADLLGQVLAARRLLRDEGHPDVLSSQSRYASALMKIGRDEESRDLFGAAIALADEGFVDNLELRGTIRVRYGEALTGVERFDEAENLLLEGHHLLTERLGNNHRSVRRTTKALTELYDAWGRADDAASWRQRMADDEANQSSDVPSSEDVAPPPD